MCNMCTSITHLSHFTRIFSCLVKYKIVGNAPEEQIATDRLKTKK